MNEAEYVSARRQVLVGGDPSAELMEACRRVVEVLARQCGLPLHYSPYGVWSDEAVAEVFADWTATRLVERGQLRALLERAPTLKLFRSSAETSARQHLIDRLHRSQALNLYRRLAAMLEGDDDFVSIGAGSGRLWAGVGGFSQDPFEGDDRSLLAAAWSLGKFETIRYDAEARKLSPVLPAEELKRFVAGLLGVGVMTAATIMDAIRMRFGIDVPEHPQELKAEDEPGTTDDVDTKLVLPDLITATIAELTERQAKVLVGMEDGKTVRDLADELGCAIGTISHERTQIGAILARLGADAPKVLNGVLEALLGGNG